jgi:hypothetical protein
MVKAKKPQKKLTIAEARKRRLRMRAEEALGKVPLELAKEKAQRDALKALRDVEKEKEKFETEKEKRITNIRDLRDMYPEMSDADFKRFAKSQFGLEEPAMQPTISSKEKAKEEKRRKDLAEDTLKKRQFELAEKSAIDVIKREDLLKKELAELTNDKRYEDIARNKNILKGKATTQAKLERRKYFYAVDKAIKERENELKKIKSARDDIFERYRDLKGNPQQLADEILPPPPPKPQVGQAQAIIKKVRTPEEVKFKADLLQDILNKQPDIVAKEDLPQTNARENLVDLEARLQTLLNTGASQAQVNYVKRRINKIAREIGMPEIPLGLQGQVPMEAPMAQALESIGNDPIPPFQELPLNLAQPMIVEPEPAPIGAGLAYKYGIHPRHITETKDDYKFSEKAKKHIHNIKAILPPEQVKQIIQFSLLNKKRNEMQNLDKHFKNKNPKGYKSHGGGIFSFLF